MVRMHPKDALGRQGEQLAAEYLQKAGFVILDRNYRCADGEIDIVAADRRALGGCAGKTPPYVGYCPPAPAGTPPQRPPPPAPRAASPPTPRLFFPPDCHPIPCAPPF